MCNGLAGISKRHLFSINADGPAISFVCSEQGLQNLTPSGAHQTCDSQKFSFIESETHILDLISHGQMFYFQGNLFGIIVGLIMIPHKPTCIFSAYHKGYHIINFCRLGIQYLD